MAKFIAPPELMYSPQFMALALMAANVQAPGKLRPDGRLEINTTNMQALTGAAMTGFVGAGGEIEDAPVFLVMTAEDYAGEVPAGMRNATQMDDSETETARKWIAWKDENHEHLTAADGRAIVPGNSWGSELTASELTLLVAGGYTILVGHELAAILPVETLEAT